MTAERATGVALGLAVSVLPGCGPWDHAAPTCAGNLHAYKGACLSNTAIVYAECTRGRGMNVTKEISGKAGGTFRVVANSSLQAAYKKSQTEDQPVAMQIVHDCLAIAKESSDDAADRTVAAEAEQQAATWLARAKAKDVAGTPHLKLSRTRIARGQQVTVDGVHFWPDETVDVMVFGMILDQVQADSAGSFRATVRMPHDVPGIARTIDATGETSVEHASAPFTLG